MSSVIDDNNIVSQGIDEKGIEGYLSSDLNSLDNNKQWRVFGKYDHYIYDVYYNYGNTFNSNASSYVKPFK